MLPDAEPAGGDPKLVALLAQLHEAQIKAQQEKEKLEQSSNDPKERRECGRCHKHDGHYKPTCKNAPCINIHTCPASDPAKFHKKELQVLKLASKVQKAQEQAAQRVCFATRA